MQGLKELVLLLQRHNIHPLKHLSGTGEGKSKLLAFYDGIIRNKFNSDEEAAIALYKEEGGGSKYRKLKSDLRERLLDAVININTELEHYSDYQKAYYDCHKQWVMVRFLTGQNANTAALALANRLLRQSEKFDFTLLCMDIASYLRIQYGLRESNDKRFKEANQLFDQYRKLYDAECLAEELYSTLVVRTVNNRSAQDEVHRLAIEYYERIEPLLHEYHSYKLNMYGYMIGLMLYTTVNDYEEALKYCEKAIDFFNKRPYEARVPLQIFYYQHLIGNIHLRRFEEGRKSVQHCIRLMEDGTFNWFKFKELNLLLLLHIKQYEQAAEVLLGTLEHPRFEFLPENARELWRIYEPYVYYLTTLGKIKSPLKNKFKLAKFINEVPIFSKDKSGMNIAILVIKILIQLQEHKYSRVLDEVEATEQYCYRHLRGEDTQRSYNFLKMLLQIPMGQFDKNTVVPKAERYLEKIKAIPLQLANQTHEIEIIPYEDLWDYALESLETRPEKPSKRASAT
ncbi:MAG: hypothetical protein IPJ82_05725 [Lewinellaceae bacterium]|nr:hypothetical protein [Lewinellaceae bacterium]